MVMADTHRVVSVRWIAVSIARTRMSFRSTLTTVPVGIRLVRFLNVIKALLVTEEISPPKLEQKNILRALYYSTGLPKRKRNCISAC